MERDFEEGWHEMGCGFKEQGDLREDTEGGWKGKKESTKITKKINYY